MIERMKLIEECPTCIGTGSAMYSAARFDPTKTAFVSGTCGTCHGSGEKHLPAEHLEALLSEAWDEIDQLKQKLTAAETQAAIYQRWLVIKANSEEAEKERAEKHAFSEASKIAAKHPEDAISHRVDPNVAPRAAEYRFDIRQDTIDKAFAGDDISFIKLWLMNKGYKA